MLKPDLIIRNICQGTFNPLHYLGTLSTHLQCTVIGPSCPNWACVLWTCEIRSMSASADLDIGTPLSGQSENWNCLRVRDCPSCLSVIRNSLRTKLGILYSTMGSTKNRSYRWDRSDGQYWKHCSQQFSTTWMSITMIGELCSQIIRQKSFVVFANGAWVAIYALSCQ